MITGTAAARSSEEEEGRVEPEIAPEAPRTSPGPDQPTCQIPRPSGFSYK
jgi:hypothetical protein